MFGLVEERPKHAQPAAAWCETLRLSFTAISVNQNPRQSFLSFSYVHPVSYLVLAFTILRRMFTDVAHPTCWQLPSLAHGHGEEWNPGLSSVPCTCLDSHPLHFHTVYALESHTNDILVCIYYSTICATKEFSRSSEYHQWKINIGNFLPLTAWPE